ncbi:MAG: hypothetical protein FJX72_10765 [Armatimonadetes bacterium]|nr:hypothetical protein [Armatimonadota bacterium]
MNVLAENEGKTYAVLAVDAPDDFVSPFPGALFACMLWDHDGRFTETQRSEVAKRLLQAGCRYAVCGGQNCEAWHDAVDEEFVRLHVDDPDQTADAVHVMTTWHANETPDDVAFFFVLNTNFDDHDFDRYLVVHVGDGHARGEVDAAVRRHAVNK